MRQQDQRWGRLVLVKLGEEGIQHLARRQASVSPGKIRAIAPVLVGAEKEHFNAELAGVFNDGEHIGFLHRARIDALRALNGGERGDAVAQAGGALIFLLFGCDVHVRRQMVLDGPAFAGEEALGVRHQASIVRRRHLPRAGG